MHIAYVCPAYPPGSSANGVSTYTAILAEELVTRGHYVSLFCFRRGCVQEKGKPQANKGVRIYPAEPRCFRWPIVRIVYYRLGAWLRPGHLPYRDQGIGLREAVATVHGDLPIDIIECPDARGYSYWLRSLSIPVVVHLHAPRAVTARVEGEFSNRQLHQITQAERRCLTSANGVTAPTWTMVNETERVLGVKMNDVRIIPNPVELRSSEGGSDSSRMSRDILFVGRLDALKGFDVLIKAFAYLVGAKGAEDVALTAVGPDRGRFLDGRHVLSGASYVRKMLPNPAMACRIKLLGLLPYEQVQGFRTRGRITVVPSRFENFAGTIIEAMAAGCPVVASDAGGTPEIIQHERNGLLFHSGDWQGLAKCLERLLKDTPLRMRLGAQAQDDVRTRYNPQTVAAQSEQFYRDVIDRFRYSH